MNTSGKYAGLTQQVRQWITEDPDPATQAELTKLLAELPHSAADLAERFAGRLQFGTAGLRGPVRAGPNGMNRAVVRATTAGFMAYLDKRNTVGPIVIGYDTRHHSHEFAQETARIVAGYSRRALLLSAPCPTPLLAYAVRVLEAVAGIMITASHNPPADNGYKVYLQDGAQIAPPVDTEISKAIAGISLPTIAIGKLDAPQPIDAIAASYIKAVANLVVTPASRKLSVVYTPIHGVGAELLGQVFTAAGFSMPLVVSAQAKPDPDFPTTPFPNPEEPGVMDLAIQLATETNADLVLANDPDADRCAVAVPEPGSFQKWRILRGDEIGILLADHLMRRNTPGTYVTTIVSASMLRAMCSARGFEYAETLTGFKWIMQGAKNIVFGYEEALGYAIAPRLVRDKDGLSAALLIAEVASEIKAAGKTFTDRLNELETAYGVHATDQIALRVAERTQIENLMRELRDNPPTKLLGKNAEYQDLLPKADVVIIRTSDMRAVVRPSGTEPKLKIYLQVVMPVDNGLAVEHIRGLAQKELANLREQIGELFAKFT